MLILFVAFTVIPNGQTWLINPSNLAFASYNTPLGGTNKTTVLLPFEQNVLDSSQSHNNGLVTGNAQYVTGKVGTYAFSFNGGTHVTLANPSQFAFEKSNPFSISFWIKMAPNSSKDMYLVSNSNDQNSAGISIWKSHLSNTLTFKIQNTYGKVIQVSGTSNISDNTWHLILFTYDGSSNQKGMKTYIDGSLQAVGAAASISGTIVTNKAETIGSTVSGVMPFSGILDNVQILNYLMSPSALKNFFTTTKMFPPILYAPITTKSGVSLSWLPVIGAKGYNVYRDGIKVTTVLEPSPSYFDSGLASSTSHSYHVIAVNATGGTSPSSQTITATTQTTSLNPPIRAVVFSPNITTATYNILKANFKAGDGMIATRVPYVEQFQNNMKIPGLKHFILAPRITALDPTCDLGSVPSLSQFVTQSQQAKLAGYYIDAIVYDIEGWCWTPQIEQQNYVSYIDQAAQLAHAGGLKSGVVPTHSELLQWYKNIHWNNIDYLFIQFQKQIMTKESNYTLEDPKYFTDMADIINTARAQNPNITIFVHYSDNWEPTGSMVDSINHFKNQIQGVNMYDLPKNNPNNIGSPYPGNNTPSHQDQFLKAVKST